MSTQLWAIIALDDIIVQTMTIKLFIAMTAIYLEHDKLLLSVLSGD